MVPSHAHTHSRSIVLGIANEVGDRLGAINDAYRHDVSLLMLPALPTEAGRALQDVRHAARHTRLHVLLGTEILIDSMGSVLNTPPFETPFGQISTTRRQTASGIHYVTLTCV